MAMGIILDVLLGLPHLAASPWNLVGTGLLGFGLFLEVWSTFVLWKHGSGTPNPVDPPKRLVTEGPYRRSRNPLYLARISILLGSSGILASPGILAVALALVLGLHFVLLPKEEKRIQLRFGAEYVNYKQRVPRWFSIRSLSGSQGKTP